MLCTFRICTLYSQCHVLDENQILQIFFTERIYSEIKPNIIKLDQISSIEN